MCMHICIIMCSWKWVPAQVCACYSTHVEVIRKPLMLALTLSRLRQGLLLAVVYLRLAGPWTSRDFRLYFPFQVRSTEITVVCHNNWLFMGSGDLNSGAQVLLSFWFKTFIWNKFIVTKGWSCLQLLENTITLEIYLPSILVLLYSKDSFIYEFVPHAKKTSESVG